MIAKTASGENSHTKPRHHPSRASNGAIWALFRHHLRFATAWATTGRSECPTHTFSTSAFGPETPLLNCLIDGGAYGGSLLDKIGLRSAPLLDSWGSSNLSGRANNPKPISASTSKLRPIQRIARNNRAVSDLECRGPQLALRVCLRSPRYPECRGWRLKKRHMSSAVSGPAG